jgi:hypothetical protein
MIFVPTVSADTHDAILRTADSQRIPLTFCGRGEVELLDDVWLQVPRSISKSGYLLLPKGWCSDGASIPQIAQSFVGHPFADTVLIPALVHDHGCVHRHLPSPVVHWGFYQMNVWHGTTYQKSRAVYAAVRYFGPRWRMP